MKRGLMIFGLMIVLLSCFVVAEVSSSVTHDFYVSENVVSGAGVSSEGGEVFGVDDGICSQEAFYLIVGIVVLVGIYILFRLGRKKRKVGSRRSVVGRKER